MKFKEMPEGRRRWIEREVLEQRFSDLQGSVRNAFKRIAQYLFILNAGSAVAAATQMARDSNSIPLLQFPMRCFVVGIIAITLHATWDYYRCLNLFQKFRSNLKQFFASEIDWELLVERDARRFEGEIIGHLLAWLAGFSFALGFITACVNLGLFSILALEPKNLTLASLVCILPT
jgi:hypothetical protein